MFLQKHQSVKTKYRQNLSALDWVHSHAIFMLLRPLPDADGTRIAHIHIAFHWQFWQKPGCLLPLLLLLSAPLQNLRARIARALNIKIKHVLKISECNQKLSLKFSMIPGPAKLHKLRICFKRKLKGNNWGCWLHTSNRNPPNPHDTVN